MLPPYPSGGSIRKISLSVFGGDTSASVMVLFNNSKEIPENSFLVGTGYALDVENGNLDVVCPYGSLLRCFFSRAGAERSIVV
ncbi:hypothetical protein DPMN_008744 [Dreissena polymorpha]|uniref:Uncharacterized protein n=1 Tax=Dreissena polymorpha TaxID=45954 RepID=A0A9D4RZI9_DREPO|nr:hypothetical protein DPMN_008744 [Dreissena polymorpha]